MRNIACIAVCLSMCVTFAEPQPIRLSNGGESAVIILPTDVERLGDTQSAAIELRQCLSEITGRDISMFVEGRGVYQRQKRNWRIIPFDKLERPAGSPEIHVGWTERALKEIDPKTIEKLDVDGFRIRAKSDAIFLIGPRDWSTGYACYTFLEEYCGVRWYLPGDFGEEVPRNPGLTVPVVDKTFEPAYQHRQYSGFNWRNQREIVYWAKHNKIRPRLRYHHNLHRVFDVGKYGESMPEVYPIIGKRRRVPGPKTVAGWQPCLTHPKAVEITVKYAEEIFKSQPNESSISLGINDGGRYCECDRCMALVDPDADDQMRRSRWFFQYANAVAKEFDRKFPDKLIGYLLYGECKDLPEGLKTHPRLIGFYVTPSYTLITPEGKERFDDGLKELTKSVSRFALYDWFYGDGICVPRLQIRQAKYYLEHGYSMGARHLKAEAYMNWGLDGFKYWMHARLMWDPTREVDAMLDDVMNGFFKESAGPMREYFKIVEHYSTTPVKAPHVLHQDAEPSVVNYRFRFPGQLLSFPPKAVEECLPHLERAEQAAQSHIVRERVRYFRSAFEVSRMMTMRYHRAMEAQPLLTKADTLPEGLKLLADAMSKEYDVEQYYKWALRGDPYCVRYPERTMFGATTKARGMAAKTLGDQVITQLKEVKRPISQVKLDTIVRGVTESALGRIKDADARENALISVAPFAGKVILCNRQPAPKIDGNLDDACWTSTQPITDFATIGTGKSSSYRTEARLTHDGERLYFSARCFQDTSRVLAWTKERDGRVWREDGLELLLNLPSDTTKEERFQVIVNTNGNMFDYYNGNADWDGDIKVGTSKTADAYTVEMSIPLKEINMHEKPNLRVNIVRNVYDRADLKHGEPESIATWYLTDTGNLAVRARGWLIMNP